MLNKYLLLIGFSLFAIQNFAFEITVKITGAGKKKHYLGYYYGDKQYLRDSATADATGKMIFKGKENLPGGIYLIASAEKALLFDFVVTEQNFLLETDTVDYNKHMKVKNSVENTAFFEYTNFTTKIADEVTPLDKAYKEAKAANDTAKVRYYREKIIAAENNLNQYRNKVAKEKPNLLIAKIFKMMKDVDIPDAPLLPNGRKDSTFAYHYFKSHYFDNIDLSDDRIVYTPVFHSKLEYYLTKLTIQIPDSIISSIDTLMKKAMPSKETRKWCIYWITNHYESSQYMGMDEVFVHMVDQYYSDTTIAFWVDETTRFKITDRADNLRNNLLGKVAPNLNMPDTGWRMHAIHDIKAKYTMVLFWDATCGRCKEEIPRLKVLYDSLEKVSFARGKSFEVYAVSLTADGELWKKYVKDNNLKWINVSDLYNNTKFRKLYDIYSTPVIYLLNEKKQIVAKRLSVEQVQDFINKGLE